MTTYYQQQAIDAQQYAQRERRRILAEEPDSDLAQQFRDEDAAQQKAHDAAIAAREAEEREQQEARDEAAKARLDRAQANLDERGKRVRSMLWFGIGQRPEVVMSPQTENYVLSRLDDEHIVGPDTIERIFAEGIANGSIPVDYSQANKTKHHEFLESVRASGNDIPAWIEKPASKWSDEELSQAQHLLREVPRSEAEGLKNFITTQQRKQRSHQADDKDYASPPPSFGNAGSVKYRTWRLMDREERLRAWDEFRESQR